MNVPEKHILACTINRILRTWRAIRTLSDSAWINDKVKDVIFGRKVLRVFKQYFSVHHGNFCILQVPSILFPTPILQS